MAPAEELDTATITVDRRASDSEVRVEIGLIFQQFDLFPDMRVPRNVTEARACPAGRGRGPRQGPVVD